MGFAASHAAASRVIVTSSCSNGAPARHPISSFEHSRCPLVASTTLLPASMVICLVQHTRSGDPWREAAGNLENVGFRWDPQATGLAQIGLGDRDAPIRPGISVARRL